MRKLLLPSFLLFLCVNLLANPVTQQQAQTTAQQFLAKKNASISRAKKVFKAPMVQNALQTTPPYYIFNAEDSKGFVIVSGDDSTPAILGYVSSGEFDEDKIPDGLKALLSDYAGQIDQLRKYPSNESTSWNPQSHPSIAPLLTCTWNQNDPYNSMCPVFFDQDRRCVTGCVATAMAQILYHHRSSSVSTILQDIPEYDGSTNWSGYGHLHVEGIAAGAEIHWNDMIDTYDDMSTQAQKDAVAELMRYCGTAIKMNYGTGTSYAFTSDIPDALVKYFGYSQNTQLISRTNYILDDWNKIIYNELANNRPVCYRGSSASNSGHAYVVDGYSREDDLFHINWGWGGSSDGYFELAFCKPNGGGIGAGTIDDGYMFTHQAVINAQPKSLENYDDFKLSASSSIHNQEIRLHFNNPNKSSGNFEYGIGQLLSDGTIQHIAHDDYDFEPGRSQTYTYTVNEPTFNGEIRLVPISRLAGTSEWKISWSESKYFLVKKDNGNAVSITLMPQPNLVLEKVSLGSVRRVGLPLPIKIAIKNDSEYGFVDNIYMKLVDSEGNTISSNNPLLIIEGGKTWESIRTFRPKEAGKYTLYLSYEDNIATSFYSEEIEVGDGVPETLTQGVYIKDIEVDNADIINAYEDDDHKGIVIPVDGDYISGIVKVVLLKDHPNLNAVHKALYKYNETDQDYTTVISGGINGAFSGSKGWSFNSPLSYLDLLGGKYKLVVTVGELTDNGEIPNPTTILDEYRFIIAKPATELTWNLAQNSISLGESIAVEYTCNHSEAELQFVSSNPDVATVEQVNGRWMIVGKGIGTADITMCMPETDSYKASEMIKKTITVSGRVAEGISIEKPSSKILKIGDSITLVATVTPENATDKSVKWSTSDESIATVSDNGVVNVIGIGNFTITATNSAGHRASVSILAEPIFVGSIVLSQTSATIKEAETLLLAATISPEDATYKTLIWSSSNTDVATVDANGHITAISPGETVITVSATDGSGKVANCNVNVIPIYVPDLTAPTFPLGNGITVTDQTENSITINWNAASDNVTAESALSYEIYMRERGTWVNLATTIGTTEYKIEGLEPNKQYKFVVYVSDESSNRSSYMTVTTSTSVSDSIEKILARDPDVKIFNTKGELVGKSYRGTVIINGKKYRKK